MEMNDFGKKGMKFTETFSQAGKNNGYKQSFRRVFRSPRKTRHFRVDRRPIAQSARLLLLAPICTQIFTRAIYKKGRRYAPLSNEGREQAKVEEKSVHEQSMRPSLMLYPASSPTFSLPFLFDSIASYRKE